MYDNIIEVTYTTSADEANGLLQGGWKLIDVEAAVGVATDHDGTSDIVSEVVFVLGWQGE